MLCLRNIFDSNPTTHRPEQVGNWTRFERFLLLGSERGTYYTGDLDLSIESAGSLCDCLRMDGLRVVRTIAEFSSSGRAPKNEPALFALALAASPNFADAKTNAAALQSLPRVALTVTQLCNFAAFAGKLRGWGRGLRSAIAEWYVSKPAGELAHQMMNHQSSGGWSHRDLLRMSHPKAPTPVHNALFQWAVDGQLGHLASPAIRAGELRQVQAFELAKRAASEREIVHLIEDNRLTRQMIPSAWKNSAHVWEALLDSLSYSELVRLLGKLTSVGLLAPQSPATALTVARLMDRRRVANSRVHPIQLLQELIAYKSGLEWTPIVNIAGALEQAFYLAFDNVEPTGKRIYLALDASGSMEQSACIGMTCMSPATASAAMAMLFARTEPDCVIAAFHDRIQYLEISRQHRLDQAGRAIARESSGADASLPIEDALGRGLAVDTFVIVTDNETWTGEQRPAQALERYRRMTGIPAKLVVIAMSANQCASTDPYDADQMGVAGFDASVPALVSNFIRGRLS